MVRRRLRYLGPHRQGTRTGDESAPPEELLYEGKPLKRESQVDLVRKRSPWSSSRPVERVLLGSHPARADVWLQGVGVGYEHARFYLSRASTEVNDLKVMRPDDVWVNDRAVDVHEWYDLKSGDELRLGPWRFRFEVEG